MGHGSARNGKAVSEHVPLPHAPARSGASARSAPGRESPAPCSDRAEGEVAARCGAGWARRAHAPRARSVPRFARITKREWGLRAARKLSWQKQGGLISRQNHLYNTLPKIFIKDYKQRIQISVGLQSWCSRLSRRIGSRSYRLIYCGLCPLLVE